MRRIFTSIYGPLLILSTLLITQNWHSLISLNYAIALNPFLNIVTHNIPYWFINSRNDFWWINKDGQLSIKSGKNSYITLYLKKKTKIELHFKLKRKLYFQRIISPKFRKVLLTGKFKLPKMDRKGL